MKFKQNLRCFCNDRLSNKYLLVHKSNSILSNSQYFMMMFTDRMRKVTLCEISRIVIFLYLKFRKYFYSLIANYKKSDLVLCKRWGQKSQDTATLISCFDRQVKNMHHSHFENVAKIFQILKLNFEIILNLDFIEEIILQTKNT